MSAEYVRQGRIQATSLLKEGEELTQAMIDREARSLYEMDQRRDIAQLMALRGESPEEMPVEDDGGFTVKVNNQIITRTMVSEMVAEYGKEETEQFLKNNKGLSNNQIQALLGVDMSQSQPTQEEMITEPGLINPFRQERN